MASLPPPPLPPRAAQLALAATQLGALAAVGASLARTPGFPLDDAWIHQVVARNLAHHGVLGVTSAAHSSGSSSLLWTLLLALGHRVHAPPVAWALALNAALLVAFGQGVLAAARRDGFTPWRALALAAVTSTGNAVWLALSGMEATLVCALSAAAVACWFAPGSPWRAAAPLSLLALARPDALALPWLLAARHRAAGRSLADAVRVVLAPALAFGASVALNLRLLGTPLPSTLAGRRWLNHLGSPPYGLRSVRWLLHRWPLRLASDTLLTEHPAAVVLVGALLVAGAVALAREGRQRLATLAAWALVHTVTFAALFPVTGHGGRYQPLVPALFLPLALAALWALGDRAARRFEVPAGGLALALAALVALVAVRSLARWSSITASGVAHIEHTERAMGEWIGRHLPPAARVASFDLGAVTYFSARDVVDLGGLVDPALAPRLARGEAAAYLRDHGVTHVVVPVGYDDRRPDGLHMGYRLHLHGNPAVRLTPLHRRVTPWARWWPAARPTGHASPQQVLYRFDAAGEP